jgi:acetyl esterase/lipase
VVVTGESGGGNYTLITLLIAKREGWLDRIAGAYAQCPFIAGAYDPLPEDRPSLRENDNYFITLQLLAVLAATYDPSGDHLDDPLAWAINATLDDLAGLPPVVISVNELDPLRDEGLAVYRRLLAAGVPATGRTVLGTVHGGDVLLPGCIPDVHRASIDDVSAFARAVAR